MYEIWYFSYEENGERYYEVHKYWSYREAIESWKKYNPKIKKDEKDEKK